MKRTALLLLGAALGIGAIALTAGCTAPLEATAPPESVSSEAPSATRQDDAASTDWRDGYVPCDTPSGNTMVVGCYWDQGDQPYVVTDDGETFLIDDATGDRTYVPEDQAPWYTAPDPEPAAAPSALPPCELEDSDNCYWDAATMGNGEGRSFVTLNGVTYYPESGRTVNLNGEAWPTVDGSDTILYCDAPLRVGIDVDDLGNEWAGCM